MNASLPSEERGTPLRLLVVTHNVIKGDGQGRANFEIARYARKQGIEVTLIADRVDPEMEESGVRWIRLQPKRRSNWLIHGLEFTLRANRLVESLRNDYDLIHGYGYTLDRPHHINTSQYVHSAWRKSPVHVSRQNRNLYGAYQWLYSYINAVGEKRAYANARVLVPASNTVRQELMELGFPPDRMRVILNGADPAEFHPGKEDRAALGLPENVPLALFAGDIRTGRKNLDTTLAALAKSPNLHLAVVGKKEGSPFPALAEKLGVAERTHFLDFRRDIAQIMRACDFFVFPSRYEACALVLVEAISSGLPVITAKTTGGSEVISEASGILLNDPNDAEALATAMNRLVGDRDLRQAMSMAAAESSSRYTWDKIAGAYYGLYRETASGKES